MYEQLGVGGMAYVHRAELVGEGGLRKPVALKRLQTTCAEDPELVAAFVHEAQLAAKLRHPNIAQAYDLGRIESTYYIAMELVPGPTLAQVMTQAHQGAGAIPLPIALEILIQLCDALDHAHDLRDDNGRPLDLVHRDVSPMNVIISRSGIVKLIDFGIAKAKSARRDTEVGIIKGKHAYIAPEYTHGQLDRRADLWGLGVCAHELLTGRRLFQADTDFATIRNVRELQIPPPSRYAPDVSAQLDGIVLKALERDPDQRWQTADAIRTVLVNERHRLGVAVTGRQIRDWAEWAFQQTPRSNSQVDRVLADFDPNNPTMSVSIEIECPPASRASTPPRAASPRRAPSESELLTDMVEPATTEVPTFVVASLEPSTELQSDSVELPTEPRNALGAKPRWASRPLPAAKVAELAAGPTSFSRAATLPAAYAPVATPAPVIVPRIARVAAPVAAPVARVTAPMVSRVAAPVAPPVVARAAPVVAPV
ncbi:MAG TPA: protein kinase, partial [Kofleriaceae bacterium]